MRIKDVINLVRDPLYYLLFKSLTIELNEDEVIIHEEANCGKTKIGELSKRRG